MGNESLKAAADQLAHHREGGEAGAYQRDRKRLILIVDDEKSYADRLEMEFKEAGYDALAAHDGVEGLLSSECWRPDLIVLDLIMPPPDGQEVLHMMRMQYGDYDPPVILLTGDVTDRPDLLARVYPNCHVLRKPCSREEVIHLASKLLAGWRPGADGSSGVAPT